MCTNDRSESNSGRSFYSYTACVLLITTIDFTVTSVDLNMFIFHVFKKPEWLGIFFGNVLSHMPIFWPQICALFQNSLFCILFYISNTTVEFLSKCKYKYTCL